MRRRATRRAVLGATAAGAASLAGCLDALPFGGQPDVSKWMYETGAVEEDESGLRFSFGMARPVAIDPDPPEELANYWTSAYRFEEYTDIDWDSADVVATFRHSSVLSTDYDTDEVVEELTREEPDFEAEDSYRGFDVYVWDEGGFDPQVALGLRGNLVVMGNYVPPHSARSVLETTIDTRKGDAPRQSDDDVTKHLLDTAGSGDLGSGDRWETPPFGEDHEALAGMVGRAESITVGEETSDITVEWVYENESDVDADAVRALVDEFTAETYYGISKTSVTTDGRIATISGEVATEDVQPPFSG